MRDHAIVSPRFWNGDTGRVLRKHPDAQRLALYLLTCPSSNMIGLYYLPIPTICHELNMSPEGASKALQRVFEGGFAAYDRDTEMVFVFEMARFQIGESLSPGDNRIKGVERQLELARKSRFYADFLKRYAAVFHLADISPFEAPSKPLRSQDQDQGQEQDQGEEKEDCSEPVKAPASEPTILIFPTKGRGSSEWHLTASKVAEYRESFPGVNLEAELRKALQWCRDNPTKRKTPRGMPAFLSRWLGKEQDRVGVPGQSRARGPLSRNDYARETLLDAVGGEP